MLMTYETQDGRETVRFQDEKEEAPNSLDFMSEYSFKEWHFSSFANF